MRITHLTDLHLSTTATVRPVDTVAALVNVLEAIPDSWHPDAVVVSGDVCDDAATRSYELAAELVGAYARSHGAPVLWVPGNHDQGNAFSTLHRPARGSWARGEVEVTGQRFVLADSRVPDRGYGRWPTDLGQRLAGDDVVVLHHPPLPAPSALHHALRLRVSREARAMLATHAPRLILSGHYHLWGTARIADSTVVVAPAVANRTITGNWHHEQAVAEHGCALVEVSEAITVRWVTGVGDGRLVLDLDPTTVLATARAFGHPDEPDGGVSSTPTPVPARWWVDG